MPTTTTTLTGVDTKSGSNQRGAWTLSIFTAADGGEFTTFDGGLASKASSLLNQPVTVEWEPFTKNGRESRNLKGVEVSANGSAPVSAPAQPQTTAPVPAPQKTDQFRTKEQIMRTDALNAALTLFGIIGLDPLSGVDEFQGWFESLYKLIEAGVFETPDVRVEA